MGAMTANDLAMLSDEELAQKVIGLNKSYRDGTPEVSNEDYDSIYLPALKARVPDHPFLKVPEPEAVTGVRYRHSVSMLSTDKCYSQDEVSAWCSKIRKAAAAQGIDPERVTISVTAKLDGMAGYRYPDALVTRGEEGYGSNITDVLAKGVVPSSNAVDVAGELVVVQSYFDNEIAEQFDMEHPRNFIGGLRTSDNIKDGLAAALRAGMCHFVIYNDLPAVRVPLAAFEAEWKSIMRDVQKVQYLCDGAVAEVDTSQEGLMIRGEMGSTSKFHNWQIALKENGEGVETVVESIRLTCGRTGRITPTAIFAPVQLYGVTITNATAHTGMHLAEMGLGVGAVIKVLRSGSVIPFISEVVKRAETQIDISKCPSCGSATGWEGRYLICTNTVDCPATAARSIEHWFSTVGVVKGFGPSVCEALVKAGITLVSQIYGLDAEGWHRTGISSGIVANLVKELARSKQEPISDAVFLGAFGIRSLGKGDSRRLLEVLPLSELGKVTEAFLKAIPGFGEGTSAPIAAALAAKLPEITAVMAYGFTLTPTKVEAGGLLEGKTIVFTGTMVSASRSEMEEAARKMGAKVSGSVTGKTTLLVCGENVGEKKITAAKTLGVKVIDENEYRAMVSQ